jgi:hypothetical protein
LNKESFPSGRAPAVRSSGNACREHNQNAPARAVLRSFRLLMTAESMGRHYIRFFNAEGIIRVRQGASHRIPERD